MILYRHKKNGLLYKLYFVGRWKRAIECIPFRHDKKMGKVKYDDFVPCYRANPE